jgi:hypothetical protein
MIILEKILKDKLAVAIAELQILEVFPFVELISARSTPQDSQSLISSAPRAYIGSGEYVEVINSENYAYFRMNGRASVQNNDSEGVSGCDYIQTTTYPIRLVAYLPKTLADCDGAFAEEYLIRALIGKITGAKLGGLNVSDAYVRVTAYNTDRIQTWNSEFRGFPLASRFTHVHVYLDLNIVVSLNSNCLNIC